MIKNIIFDIGDVIIKWTPDGVFKNFKGSRADKTLLIDTVLNSSTWQDLDRGTVDIEGAKTIYAKTLPQELIAPMEYMLDNFYKLVKPYKNTSRLIKELKKQGYKLYLLSNFNEKVHPLIERYNKVFSYFDGGIFSYEELCVKPEKEIYLKLFDKYNLNPKECFFIDDKKKNVEGGRALGMQGYVYKEDFKNLKAKLTELNK